MGTGSNFAIEVAQEKYIKDREKWIRDHLGEDADQSSTEWSIMEDEYDTLAAQRHEYEEMAAEDEAIRRQAIRDYVKEIELPGLVHFTQVSNLISILDNGLYSREQTDQMLEVQINDEMRLDGRPNTISTSVAFPNSRMFYKYRQEKGGNWCVVVIRKKVLWELDCLFCWHNAADSRISRIPDQQLGSIDAFRNMYRGMGGLESRSDQKLKTFDPTDEQAEILIKDHIPPEYIYSVVFADKPSQARFVDLMTQNQKKSVLHSKSKGFFASRSYVRR